MKRGLTIAVTVALVGGLLMMGLAGTAAAQDIDVELGGDGGDGGDAGNWAEVNQGNYNEQVGVASASATGAADYTSASASVDQTQGVTQTNVASVEQTADGGDGGDGGAIGIDIELILGGLL